MSVGERKRVKKIECAPVRVSEIVRERERERVCVCVYVGVGVCVWKR